MRLTQQFLGRTYSLSQINAIDGELFHRR